MLELDNTFEENSFDVVIMTQVIHHLTPDTHEQAIANIARVLKPGGTFWINTTTPHQAMNGFWWTQIVPNAACRVAARFTPHPVFKVQLANSGLSTVSIDIP